MWATTFGEWWLSDPYYCYPGGLSAWLAEVAAENAASREPRNQRRAGNNLVHMWFSLR